MANLKIITGATGTAHVQAADDRALNYAAFGGDGILAPNGTYHDRNNVLCGNNVLSASLVDASTVRISDGDILIQGCHARLEYGQHIDLAIQPGVADRKRRDVVAAHYVKDDLGVESVELVMLTGTPYTGNIPVWPTELDPEATVPSLYKGATEAYTAIYVIDLTGTKVASPKLACDVIKPLHEVGRFADEVADYYNDFARYWNDQIVHASSDAIDALSDNSINHIIASAVKENMQTNITGVMLKEILVSLFKIVRQESIQPFTHGLQNTEESLYAKREAL